jgi:hypothetical protein
MKVSVAEDDGAVKKDRITNKVAVIFSVRDMFICLCEESEGGCYQNI